MSDLSSPYQLHLVEGWTNEVGPFTLEGLNGPLSLDGMTVSIVLKGKLGTPILAPSTRVHGTQSGDTTGYVYYTPAAADLLASESPYTLHWKVVDGSGAVVFFPSGKSDLLVVEVP